MIKSRKHKGLRKFFEEGDTSKIQPKHAEKLSLLLFQLASAIKPEDMNTPGNGFHKLTGGLKGHYSIKVSASWRLIFMFDRADAILVDYLNYH